MSRFVRPEPAHAARPARNRLPRPLVGRISPLVLALLALLLSLSLAPPAAAQAPIEAAALQDLSTRAEGAIRSGTVSMPILESLRNDLAHQRDALERATTTGDLAVERLQAALAELGPAPAENETEARRIADQRAALREELAEADAPHLAERQSLAEVRLLISAIDAQIRARQKQALLSRGPSPLLPETLARAVAEISHSLARFQSDIVSESSLPSRWPKVQAALVTALFTVPLGLLVWGLGLPWLLARIEPSNSSGRVSSTRSALALLASFALPWLSVVLLIAPLLIADIRPQATATLLGLIAWVPLLFAGAEWLGQALFAPRAPGRRIVRLDGRAPRRALQLMRLFGAILFAELLVESLATDGALGPAPQALLGFLLIAVAALALWRFAGLFLAASPEDRHDQAWLLVRVLRFAALLMLAGSAAGYVALSRSVLDSLLLSLWLIGFAVVVQVVVLALLARLRLWLSPQSGAPEGALWPLAPIAVGLCLALLSLPMHALIWGARLADLADSAALLRDGIDIGNTHLSAITLITGMVAFIVGLGLTRWGQRLLRRDILPRTRVDRGGQSSIVTGFGYAGVLLSALVAITAAGVDLASLAIVAGALSVGIGFGLQAIVSNFVSGLILLVERPIKEGDWIEVSGQSGLVRRIAVRSTLIETFDGHDLIVPNADLVTGLVRNMTLSSASSRISLPVGVAYGSPLDEVRDCLLEVARSHRNVLARPEPLVLLMGPGDSAVQLELRCFVADATMGALVRSDLYFAIFRVFSERGIVFPFPVRDLRITGLPVPPMTAEEARQV